MSGAMPPVLLERRGACALVTLNRPDALNAINTAMLDAFDAALDEVAAGDAIALVLTGAGRAFCAGTDLKGDDHPPGVDRADFADARVARLHALLLRLAAFPVATIAALNGLAYGGGLELALGCTFRVAAASAKFALPEIRLGLMPSYGGTVLLPRLIGEGRALQMMLTGESIDAAEAQRIGLINAVGEDALAGALALSERLPHGRGIAQRMIRDAVSGAAGLDTAAALAHEAAAVAKVARSDEIRDVAARFAARKQGG